MPLTTRIYGNGGAGGPVDRTAPLAEVAGPPWTWQSQPLEPGSDWTFAARNVDTGSGLEEFNTDATARVVVGPGGEDVTARPAPPTNLHAEWVAPDGVRVSWAYLTPGARPEEFRVWVRAGDAVDYGLPWAVAEPFREGWPSYVITIRGLASGVTYAVAVRARDFDTGRDDGGTIAVSVVAHDAGPAAVGDLTATAVSG